MILISCPFGLTSLLTKEIKHLGIQPIDSFPSGCRIDSKKWKDIITLNLSLRIANKVYLELTQWPVYTFEDLFQLVQTIQREHYFKTKTPFRVTALSKESILHAPRTIQSIGHKAIVTQLTGSPDKHRESDEQNPIEVLIRIFNNKAHILLNTSGPSLHRRGRRIAQWEAPIKENLAMATLLQASWSFNQPLRDPCCGSGTLVIEAARYARNILSGKQRRFDFQRLANYAPAWYEWIRAKLVDQEIKDKTRNIIWSDHDPAVLEMAKRNAKQAGVDDIVQFYEHDMLNSALVPPLTNIKIAQTIPKKTLNEGFHQVSSENEAFHPTSCCIISNPPYGQRLEDKNIDDIHFRLAELMQKSWRNGAVITWYEHAKEHFPSHAFKNKETRNGPDKVMIWARKKFKR